MPLAESQGVISDSREATGSFHTMENSFITVLAHLMDGRDRTPVLNFDGRLMSNS
jgi:hypothetical protein